MCFADGNGKILFLEIVHKYTFSLPAFLSLPISLHSFSLSISECAFFPFFLTASPSHHLFPFHSSSPFLLTSSLFPLSSLSLLLIFFPLLCSSPRLFSLPPLSPQPFSYSFTSSLPSPPPLSPHFLYLHASPHPSLPLFASPFLNSSHSLINSHSPANSFFQSSPSPPLSPHLFLLPLIIYLIPAPILFSRLPSFRLPFFFSVSPPLSLSSLFPHL